MDFLTRAILLLNHPLGRSEVKRKDLLRVSALAQYLRAATAENPASSCHSI